MTYSIPGTNTLLLGATGSGKTYSLRSLVTSGVQTFVLFTEPGMRTISDIPCTEGLHWRYISPALSSFTDMASTADKVNRSFDLESLTKIKNWDKTKHRQWLEVITSMNSFTCDRCGVNFGGIDEWKTDRAIAIDSLSGLSIMAMDFVAGPKPVKAPADWGTAMDQLERFLNRMCTGTQCHFILTAHLERERDEVSGGIQLMASTLGQKLAPKIPRYFDDVILCRREIDKFYWSTAASNVDVKGRNLSIGDKLSPDFGLILAAWKKAGGLIQPTTGEPPTAKTVSV